MNRYLVTGGAGFIGSHICEELTRLGHDVVVLDNFSTGHRENLAHLPQKRVTVIEGDITHLCQVMDAAKGTSGIFHQAAVVSVPLSISKPLENFQVNSLGMLHILEAARILQIPRIVYASSAAVYGDQSHLPIDEKAPLEPLSPYGLAKLQDEQFAKMYAKLYQISSVGLRYFNVFGERQDPNSPYSGVISIFLKMLKEKKPITVFGDGSQTRDFIYVRDIAALNVAAMSSASIQQGEAAIFNAGTGVETTLLQLIEILRRLYDHNVEVIFREARSGDIYRSYSVNDALKKKFTYAEFTRFEEGIKRLMESVL